MLCNFGAIIQHRWMWYQEYVFGFTYSMYKNKSGSEVADYPSQSKVEKLNDIVNPDSDFIRQIKIFWLYKVIDLYMYLFYP